MTLKVPGVVLPRPAMVWMGVAGLHGAEKLPHAAVRGVGYGELAVRGEGHGAWGVEGCGDGRSGIAGKLLDAVARDRGDVSADCIDAADAVVEAVGDVEVAGAVEGKPARHGEGGGRSSSAVSGASGETGAGDRADDAGGGVDDSDALIVGVGDVEATGAIDGEPGWGVDGGGSGRTVIAGEELQAIAGDGGDAAGGCGQLADAVIAGVGDVEIPGGVEGERGGIPELSGSGRTVVTGVSGAADAGDGGDDAGGGVDLADAVVVGVGDVEVSGRIDGERGGRIQGRGGGEASVAAVALDPVAGDGGDDAAGAYFPDNVVPGLSEVEIAIGVEGDGFREGERDGGRGRSRGGCLGAGEGWREEKQRCKREGPGNEGTFGAVGR